MPAARGTLTRRQFIRGTGACAFGAAGLAHLGPAAADNHLVLRPQPGSVAMVPSAPNQTAIWGYGGAVPGPVLRVRQGDIFSARLENGLDQPTTIHWHGIRIDNRMDGVAGLTQEAVPPGESFDYRFTVPDAGTFWYHPHNRSWEQVARGLYGALIVEEPEPPQVDQDIVLVIDDWRMTNALQIDEDSFGAMMDWSHGGRLGNFLTVNGLATPDFAVMAGERLRLRLLNTANARTFNLKLEGHDAALIALDGQPIAPRPLGPGALTLAAGQRADLIVDMSLSPGGQMTLVEASTDDHVPAATFSYDGAAVARENPLDAPIALSANPLSPAGDLSDAQVVPLRIEGGAMGRMTGAMYNGQSMDMRTLVGNQMVWALNGVAGLDTVPLLAAARGQPIVLEMINDTVWPHAMHIHGHHMMDLAGLDDPGGPVWRDTVLVEPGATGRYGFVADNPGQWLIHCHMLEHQVAGMTTWFEVTA